MSDINEFSYGCQVLIKYRLVTTTCGLNGSLIDHINKEFL